MSLSFEVRQVAPTLTPIPGSTAVKLGDAIPQQPVTLGAVFYTYSTSFRYFGGTVRLAGSSDGTGDVCVDDQITLRVTRPGGGSSTYVHDFSNRTAKASSQSLPPIDVTQLLWAGGQRRHVEYQDLCGSNKEASSMWLVAPARYATPTRTPTITRTPTPSRTPTITPTRTATSTRTPTPLGRRLARPRPRGRRRRLGRPHPREPRPVLRRRAPRWRTSLPRRSPAPRLSPCSSPINQADRSPHTPGTSATGAAATAQHPSHTYAQAGKYTVSLTASGPNGSDTETKPGYIEVLPAPRVIRTYPLHGQEHVRLDPVADHPRRIRYAHGHVLAQRSQHLRSPIQPDVRHRELPAPLTLRPSSLLPRSAC